MRRRLQGQTGLVVSAKDNGGNALPYEYEQYYASHNGDDLVLTLDTNVQYYLEKYVKEMADQFEAPTAPPASSWTSRPAACWAWCPYPNYDLNNYSEVSDARLKAAIEDSGPRWRISSCASGATRPSTIPMSPAPPSRS